METITKGHACPECYVHWTEGTEAPLWGFGVNLQPVDVQTCSLCRAGNKVLAIVNAGRKRDLAEMAKHGCLPPDHIWYFVQRNGGAA